MAEGKYTVAVDLGESSVVAVAGCSGVDGSIHIGAVAKRSTCGIKVGRIENIAQINDALSGVVAELESRLNVEIQHAYGGISGEFVRCDHHAESILVAEPNTGVTASDVMALHTLMRGVVAPEDDRILEYLPENYIVDNRADIKNPVGAFGHSLSSNFIFTLCDKEAIKRLNLAFIQSGISMKSCFANSVVAAEAVLTAEERESGVAVVDLGEGVTNVAIYSRGVLRYMVSIPIGGAAINHDICSLMIKESNVESIKRENGCAIAALADEGSVQVAGRTTRDNKSIPIYNIAVAIESRLTDIIVFVLREIRDAGYENRLPYGIVLTGGGANMRSIEELFRRETALDVRIATPEEHIDDDSVELVNMPDYSTVIGILMRGIALDAKDPNRSCTVSVVSEVAPEPEPAPEEEVELDVVDVVASEEEPAAEGVTQATLDLDGEEYEEDDGDEEEEESPNRRRGGGGSLFGFIKNISDKVNNIFTSSGDTEL